MLAVPDIASAVADALDEMGLGVNIGADVLGTRCRRPARLCGPAVTLRYVPFGGDATSKRIDQQGEEPFSETVTSTDSAERVTSP